MSQLLESGGHSIGASASASVLRDKSSANYDPRARSSLPPILCFLFLIFLMWAIFKVYCICYNIASVLCFLGAFGREACGILAPKPGIKPASVPLEGEVLTTGPPGKVPVFVGKGLVVFLFVFSFLGHVSWQTESYFPNQG